MTQRIVPVWEALLPVAGAACGISTIVTCYIVTRHYVQLPDGNLTPPISFLGCESPARYVYQFGFALTGCILLYFVHHAYRQFLARVVRSTGVSAIVPFCATLTGYIATLTATGQGIIPLEPGILLILRTQQPQSMMSKAHVTLASVFFLSAAIHTYGVTYMWLHLLINRLRSNSNSNDSNNNNIPHASVAYFTISFALKVALTLLSVFSSAIAEWLHPATFVGYPQSSFNVTEMFARAGIAQYTAVSAFIMFFGLYSLDLYVLGGNMSSTSTAPITKTLRMDQQKKTS